MKKVWILCFILILFVGCSNQTDPINENESPTPEDKTQLVEKIDSSKDYVYVVEEDGLSLKDIMAENGLSDVYEQFMDTDDEIDKFFNQNYESSKYFSNELVEVNIKSDDANELNEYFKKVYNENKNDRLVVDEEYITSNNSFIWKSMYLGETYQSDSEISFEVISSLINYPGSSNSTKEFYTFSLVTGDLLTNNQVLANHDINMDEIKQYITNDFSTNTVNYYEGSISRKLVDNVEQVNLDDFDNTYFKIPENNSIIIDDEKIYIIMNMYMGMFDDFVYPITYEIPIKSLN